MGSDDCSDVLVEHGESSFIPLEYDANRVIRRRPPFHVTGGGREALRDAMELGSILAEASFTQCGSVGHGVEFEIVDLAVELEFDHPLH